MSLTSCLKARTATVEFVGPHTSRVATVALPADWSRSVFMEYVRREHPDEAAILLNWGTVYGANLDEPKLWIVNPEAFTNFWWGSLKER